MANDLCRATIADVDRVSSVITLHEHKTANRPASPGTPRRTCRPDVLRLFRSVTLSLCTSAVLSSVHNPRAGKAWCVENLSRTDSRLRDLAGLPRDLVL